MPFYQSFQNYRKEKLESNNKFAMKHIVHQDPNIYRNATSFRKYLVIGDSSAKMFFHIKNAFFINIQGKSIQSLCNKFDLQRKSIERWSKHLKISGQMIFCFGQTDFNFERYEKVLNQQDQQERIFEDYISWIASLKVKSHVIGIAISPVRQEYIVSSLQANGVLCANQVETILQEFYRSEAKRQRWNSLMENFCKKYGINFINLFKQNGILEEKFVDHNPLSVRLRYLPCILRLKQILKDLTINIKEAQEIEAQYEQQQIQRFNTKSVSQNKNTLLSLETWVSDKDSCNSYEHNSTDEGKESFYLEVDLEKADFGGSEVEKQFQNISKEKEQIINYESKQQIDEENEQNEQNGELLNIAGLKTHQLIESELLLPLEFRSECFCQDSLQVTKQNFNHEEQKVWKEIYDKTRVSEVKQFCEETEVQKINSTIRSIAQISPQKALNFIQKFQNNLWGLIFVKIYDIEKNSKKIASELNEYLNFVIELYNAGTGIISGKTMTMIVKNIFIRISLEWQYFVRLEENSILIWVDILKDFIEVFEQELRQDFEKQGQQMRTYANDMYFDIMEHLLNINDYQLCFRGDYLQTEQEYCPCNPTIFKDILNALEIKVNFLNEYTKWTKKFDEWNTIYVFYIKQLSSIVTEKLEKQKKIAQDSQMALKEISKNFQQSTLSSLANKKKSKKKKLKR